MYNNGEMSSKIFLFFISCWLYSCSNHDLKGAPPPASTDFPSGASNATGLSIDIPDSMPKLDNELQHTDSKDETGGRLNIPPIFHPAKETQL